MGRRNTLRKTYARKGNRYRSKYRTIRGKSRKMRKKNTKKRKTNRNKNRKRGGGSTGTFYFNKDDYGYPTTTYTMDGKQSSVIHQKIGEAPCEFDHTDLNHDNSALLKLLKYLQEPPADKSEIYEQYTDIIKVEEGDKIEGVEPGTYSYAELIAELTNPTE